MALVTWIGAVKAYLILAAVVGFGLWSWWMYGLGVDSCRAKATAAALAHREREGELLSQLETAKSERTVVYRDRLQVVKEANDACLDTKLPADVSRVLR